MRTKPREDYWDIVEKKAENNNLIDLNAYAIGVKGGVNGQQERSYSEEDMEEMYNYGYNNYLPYEQAIEKIRKTK